MNEHGDKPKIETLLQNTRIINRTTTKNKLYIAEAVAIEIKKPTLNVQKEFDYTLPPNMKSATQQTPRYTRDTQIRTHDDNTENDEPRVTRVEEATPPIPTSQRCLRQLPHRRKQPEFREMQL